MVSDMKETVAEKVDVMKEALVEKATEDVIKSVENRIKKNQAKYKESDSKKIDVVNMNENIQEQMNQQMENVIADNVLAKNIIESTPSFADEIQVIVNEEALLRVIEEKKKIQNKVLRTEE